MTLCCLIYQIHDPTGSLSGEAVVPGARGQGQLPLRPRPRRAGDDGLSGVHCPSDFPYPGQRPGHHSILRPLCQCSSGKSPEGEGLSFCSGDGRGRSQARSLKRLGSDDPEGLRSRPHDLSQVRRLDEGRRLHRGVCRRGSDHRPPEVAVHSGKAAAISSLFPGRAHGGRGAGRVFLRTHELESLRMSIIFWGISRPSETLTRSDDMRHGRLIVLDIDPRPGLSFFRDGRYRLRA